MIEFHSCLHDLELRDLRYYGPLFTWTNKQPEDPIAKKLDSVLINENWLLTFPQSVVNFLAPEFSDHSPALVSLDPTTSFAGSKPFKFFNYLTGHMDFLATVVEGWEITHPDLWSLSSIDKKQKVLRRLLKRLNKNNYSQIQKRVAETSNTLKDLQNVSLTCPSEESFLAEKLCLDELHHLKKIEEAYFQQKSRILWLQLGDQNTSYFHKMAVSRNLFNAIHSLTDLNGFTFSTPAGVGLLAVCHFKSILGPPLVIDVPYLQFAVHEATPFRCSPAQFELLALIPSDEDITRTLFKLNPNKSPGPDGLTSRFYSCSWPLSG